MMYSITKPQRWLAKSPPKIHTQCVKFDPYYQKRRKLKQFVKKQVRCDGSAATLGGQLDASGAVGAVLALAVANRVLYKIALVPLKDFVFFLALGTSFTYSVIYTTTLFYRYRQGIVTEGMLSIPKARFLFIGAIEATAQVLMLIAAANLPGALLPLLSQSLLVWNLILANIILGRQYTWSQIMGVFFVIGGVCTAVVPTEGVKQVVSYSYVALFLLSNVFPSLATIIKEKIFQEAQEKLGQPLDIFVVNTFSSISQGISTVLLLPLLCHLRNIPLSQLPVYLRDGSQCFMGITPACGGDCSGAPLIPVLYLLVNVFMNIAILYTLRTQGSLVLSLLVSVLVPLTISAFTFNLPILGPSPPLGQNFMIGTSILFFGLLIYNLNDYMKQWKSNNLIKQKEA